MFFTMLSRSRRRLALFLVLPCSLSAQTGYRIGPPPVWVHPIAADLSVPTPRAPVTNGFEYLLVDRQEALGAEGLERYRHIVYRLLDAQAVQDYSQLEFKFDPTYEHLTLHAVNLIRRGHSINQLTSKRIRIVQRESEMDYQVFDGSVSLVLLLEDVKPGDIVEYSYTRHGDNPVFAGHYMGSFLVQETVPLRRARFRLLWPKGRPLFVHRRAASLEPAVATAGPFQEYVWSATDVPPKVLDSNLPTWYDPLPEIQLSDFASWTQVAAWGDSLFTSHGAVPSALAGPLTRIRSAHASREAQILSALRFVQDDVRYLGVEIGVNSHQPYAPATVLRRGYGDCKDKVLLLVTMLRALGVTARPALVSTAYEGHVGEFHPTAAIFDHAIVEADVDGHVYWLDPTELQQRGGLSTIAPQFGAALVLGPGVDSLAVIPDAPNPEPLTEVSVVFELAAVDSPATMRVETKYRGRVADGVRSSIRQTSIEELQRQYTSFYAEAYPGIRSDAVPVIRDDEAAGVVQTTERYTIPGFWHQAANQAGHVGTFDPLELDRVIPSPTASGRTMPLAVTYPTHVRYTIEAHLREGWGIVPKVDSIETPAVRFVRRIGVRGESLTLRYDYTTLADHVLASATADHIEKMARARRLLAFSVTPPSEPAEGSESLGFNWPILLAGLFTAGLAVFGAVRVSRAPPPKWPRKADGLAEAPTGLGGWLVLVGIGVSLTPPTILVGFVNNLGSYNASTWARLTTPGTTVYHPLWAPVLLLELVWNVSFLVFACLQLWLFFQRRRWFPAVFVVLAGARLTIDWLDAFLANAIPAVHAHGVSWYVHVRNLLILSIWIAYMLRSRRVQNTFVN